MRTMNRGHILMQDHRFYPRSLLGEMILGVLASVAIGTGFSILAGAFVLFLAGGRVEAISTDAVGTAPWVQVPPLAARPVVPHHE
jgi:hypothetical protein